MMQYHTQFGLNFYGWEAYICTPGELKEERKTALEMEGLHREGYLLGGQSWNWRTVDRGRGQWRRVLYRAAGTLATVTPESVKHGRREIER